ncbi:MAG: hypothetical protein SGJ27_29255, partial [Candidatus Melainabacteria bacterium]|nr:hypothetical protein [Candidatus Melainabacteria bacterium]
DVDEDALAAAQVTMEQVDGFVGITFHCAQDFCAMFARSPVFTNLNDALQEAARMEEEMYVEYGSERVCMDVTWNDLLAQAEVVRQRRETCLVRGPKTPRERIGNIDARPDFKHLGGPGIEDKLAAWGWSDDVVKAAMRKIHSMFFKWETYREADNLRFARENVPAEMERFARAKTRGCCQSHEEVFVVDCEFEGEVRVHFGFNFGH